MSTPPAPGKGMSVKVDQELHDDLAVMLRAGITVSDAVKEAVNIVAGTWANAWASGAVPEGVIPRIVGCQVIPVRASNTGRDTGSTAPSADVSAPPGAGMTEPSSTGHTAA